MIKAFIYYKYLSTNFSYKFYCKQPYFSVSLKYNLYKTFYTNYYK